MADEKKAQVLHQTQGLCPLRVLVDGTVERLVAEWRPVLMTPKDSAERQHVEELSEFGRALAESARAGVALEADNAVLMNAVSEVRSATLGNPDPEHWEEAQSRILRAVNPLISPEHPGTELLKELRTLRELVKKLEAKHDADYEETRRSAFQAAEFTMRARGRCLVDFVEDNAKVACESAGPDCGECGPCVARKTLSTWQAGNPPPLKYVPVELAAEHGSAAAHETVMLVYGDAQRAQQVANAVSAAIQAGIPPTASVPQSLGGGIGARLRDTVGAVDVFLDAFGPGFKRERLGSALGSVLRWVDTGERPPRAG